MFEIKIHKNFFHHIISEWFWLMLEQNCWMFLIVKLPRRWCKKLILQSQWHKNYALSNQIEFSSTGIEHSGTGVGFFFSFVFQKKHFLYANEEFKCLKLPESVFFVNFFKGEKVAPLFILCFNESSIAIAIAIIFMVITINILFL